MVSEEGLQGFGKSKCGNHELLNDLLLYKSWFVLIDSITHKQHTTQYTNYFSDKLRFLRLGHPKIKSVGLVKKYKNLVRNKMLSFTNYPIVMKLLGVSHLARFLKGDVHHVLKPCVAQFKRKPVNPLIVLRKNHLQGKKWL